jgi:tetratricopeptide (TPR) repeat protein
MLAIADPDRAEQWTTTALAVFEKTTDARTKRWAVSLYNNLGWARFELNPERALGAFEAALARAEGHELHIARWTVARCLRELGRTSEALEIQEALLADVPDDSYVIEELRLLRAD